MDGDAPPAPYAGDATALQADLVLEGGGVKALGLVGAVSVFAAAGYTFPRVAGTSAGAVVATLVAALQRAGEPASRLEELARGIDPSRLRDRGRLGRLLGPLGSLADAASLLVEGGLYEGAYLRRWLSGTLGDLGVRVFGDLRLSGAAAQGLAPHEQYALVVTASDVSRRRLARLPWDFAQYGLDADDQSVVEAVAASSAIPFFFEPVRLARSRRTAATLVDGGLLSNYPITIFDRRDDGAPRWPTFGVRLSGREDLATPVQPVRHGILGLGLAVVETALNASDARHIEDPCVTARTVFVDTTGVSAVDFDVDEATRQRLLAAGREAAEAYLAAWDEPEYLRRCREVVPS